jgi:hypothetical protein
MQLNPQTYLGLSFPLLYVLEECQNLALPNTLRTLKYKTISRFCTQGRNFGLSYIGLCQRLSSVDTSLVEISGVKYWFRQSGENDLRKARSWLDKDHVWRLKDLEVGVCFQQIGSDIEFKGSVVVSQMKTNKYIKLATLFCFFKSGIALISFENRKL